LLRFLSKKDYVVKITPDNKNLSMRHDVVVMGMGLGNDEEVVETVTDNPSLHYNCA
jgi:NAD(P)H-hydrate repair Nnr-like enzyme with NAD(P)H-hydrate dehydratase domain